MELTPRKLVSITLAVPGPFELLFIASVFLGTITLGLVVVVIAINTRKRRELAKPGTHTGFEVDRSWVLVENAEAGDVESEFDRSDEAPSKYALTLSFKSVQFRVTVAGPSEVSALGGFLREHGRRTVRASLQIGTVGSLPVWIIKDDRHADRLFIRVGQEGDYIDVTIVDPKAGDLLLAVEALERDLASS